MVRSFCSAPAVLKSRDVGQKRQPEAENALVVGEFPARTDDAATCRGTKFSGPALVGLQSMGHHIGHAEA